MTTQFVTSIPIVITGGVSNREFRRSTGQLQLDSLWRVVLIEAQKYGL